MWKWLRPSAIMISALAMMAVAGWAAESNDGKAAFEVREQTMKRIGRAFYTAIGRVVRGKAELGPDTFAAAESIAALSADLGRLFPPGSDLPESRIKPEMFTAQPRVDELVRNVQQAAGRLEPALKAGDPKALAAAYAAVEDACDACHREFRKPVE